MSNPPERSSVAVAAVAITVVVLGFIGTAGLYGALEERRLTAAASLLGLPQVVPMLLCLSALYIVLFTVADRLPAPEAFVGCGRIQSGAGGCGRGAARNVSVGTDRAFPKVFAAFHLNNFNLTESVLTGRNLLLGRGNTLPVADGSTKINTYRMPGYPLLVALAGRVFRAAPTDLTGIGASTVYLQVVLSAVAIAFFATTSRDAFPS